ncbi:hypothetical protein BVC80_8199g9 [Macleaya cordata]|uniref:Uncharacterized protein n=1 Tax=Macleaya cordata TaxID=56857 RepID=A0A200QK50_MACCD|nr:hypothetical protein BVC80_8199g9 [Macleaya cordata]
MKMSPAKLIFIVALLLIISNCSCAETAEVSGDGISSPNVCQNCSICPYPCHSPPSPSGYPSYGPPPPPSQGAPVQGNCPPTPVVQCCGQHPPPNPYGYIPYDNYSASTRSRYSDRSVNSAVTFIIFLFFFSVLF